MSSHDQFEEEIDNLVEDEYVKEEDVAEEEIPDLDHGEPMDEEDEEEAIDESADGFEFRPNEEDENTMELADDSVQGFLIIVNHNGIIVSGGGDDKSYLWRCDTGEMLKCLDGHTDSVTSVGFSCDGKYVASAGMDGKVRVWNAETGDFCVSVDGPDEVVWIDWHPKGNILLAGATDSTIWMWAMPSGKFMNIFNGHAGPVTAGCFTPDGKKIVSTSEDSSFIVWDPKSATAEYRLSGEDARFHADPVTSVCVNKESTLAITGDVSGKARLVNILNGQIVASLENHSDSVETSSFCDVLPLAATGSVDGTISIWDVQTQRLRATLNHDDAVVKVKFVKNSPMLASCSADRTIRMWDARTGECVKTWVGHRDTVLDIAVADDGNVICSASDDGTCLVFSM
ncbi:WD40-repeat-containing domain protein [Cokeromyces recurvatus]|uniref:WD40-repeat-containing domain protein n=1 Tax=Cokeromyces recurvatus TaxID=90255 RepID=UPI002220E895|nr:WD40-repeat-containing domain protein [Cokeromyces recurvatus]KAI7907302.1 WD40-repeat-containing domain protein [Cokeromyces recurvatus]